MNVIFGFACAAAVVAAPRVKPTVAIRVKPWATHSRIGEADVAVAGAAAEADGEAPPLLQAATKMDRPANRVSPRERVRMVPPLVRGPHVHDGLLPTDRGGPARWRLLSRPFLASYRAVVL